MLFGATAACLFYFTFLSSVVVRPDAMADAVQCGSGGHIKSDASLKRFNVSLVVNRIAIALPGRSK